MYNSWGHEKAVGLKRGIVATDLRATFPIFTLSLVFGNKLEGRRVLLAQTIPRVIRNAYLK